jgi:Golgi phosphoprotein 3 (GPP34)
VQRRVLPQRRPDRRAPGRTGHGRAADDRRRRDGPGRATRPDDELLADAYDAIREHLDGRKTRPVIRRLSRRIGGSRDRVLDRLVDVGVLGRDRPSIWRPTRHPVIDTATYQAVLDQVRAAATGQGPVPPDIAVVLALAGPCRLLERVAPDRSTRREAKKRIAHATAETPSRRASPRS